MMQEFKVEPRHMTKSAITKMRIASMIVFLAMPLLWVYNLAPEPASYNSPSSWLNLAALIISSTLFMFSGIYCLFHPYFSRFKNLDEFEKQRDLEANGFGYYALMIALGGVLILITLGDALHINFKEIILSWDVLFNTVLTLAISGIYLPSLYKAWTIKPFEDEA